MQLIDYWFSSSAFDNVARVEHGWDAAFGRLVTDENVAFKIGVGIDNRAGNGNGPVFHVGKRLFEVAEVPVLFRVVGADAGGDKASVRQGAVHDVVMAQRVSGCSRLEVRQVENDFPVEERSGGGEPVRRHDEYGLRLNDDGTVTIDSDSSQTESAQSDSQTTSNDNVREEDKVTSDGWNPKEHEVSREPLEDGNERVTYDDGYSRVVDKDGNILSYGY